MLLKFLCQDKSFILNLFLRKNIALAKNILYFDMLNFKSLFLFINYLRGHYESICGVTFDYICFNKPKINI